MIQRRKLSTQGELVEGLASLGIRATQSSVSRDLEELGIVKVQGHYAPPGLARGFGPRGLLHLEPAGDALIVASCEPGIASAVSVEIDKAELPGIVGTIAGDDTIFIAVRGRAAQKSVLNRIRSIFFSSGELS